MVNIKIEEIHASELGGFETCPFKWLCAKLNKPQNDADKSRADMGTLLHSCYKQFYDDITKLEEITPKIIERRITAIFDYRWKNEGIKGLKKRAETCNKHWIEIEQDRLRTWKVYKPTATEKQLKFGIFTGTMDFYSYPMKSIIDWKTGDVDHITPEMIAQGKVYEYMARKNDLHVDHVYFALLYRNYFLECPIMPDSWLKEKKDDMLDRIRKNVFPKIKGGLCNNYCEFKITCDLSKFCLWDELL